MKPVAWKVEFKSEFGSHVWYSSIEPTLTDIYTITPLYLHPIAPVADEWRQAIEAAAKVCWEFAIASVDCHGDGPVDRSAEKCAAAIRALPPPPHRAGCG